MKILYFLEPRIELSAYFRYATLRNSILPQVHALKEAGAQPHIIVGDGVARRALEENLISDPSLYTVVSGDELASIAGHYDKAAQEFLIAPNAEKCNRIATVIKDALPDGYIPDLVISWESPVPYLNGLFPTATVLYQWPGLLSRQPFPEFISFDKGLLGESLLRNLKSTADSVEAQDWRREIDAVGDVLAAFDPTRTVVDGWRSRFKNLILLPLQVDNYFTVTVPLDGRANQLGLIKEVLRGLPRDTGVVVTEYRSKNVSSNVLTAENVDYLRKKHSNFIFDEQINAIPQVSQYLARALDGTITISSSVGVQAALWGKPLMCIGESHISQYSSARSFWEFEQQIKSRSAIDRTSMMHAAFKRMNVALNDIKRESRKFLIWLEAVRTADMVGGLRSGEWPEFYTNDELVQSLRSNSRTSQMLSDANYYSRQRTQDDEICKELAEQIDKRPIISFDIFDTLLVRPFMKPTEMFSFMERHVREIVARENFAFPEARRSAERHAFQAAISAGRGETTIDEIYLYFGVEQGLTHEITAKIKEFEISVEKQVLYRRKSGYKAYMQALSQRKRIIFVSDMYLPSEVLQEILRGNGYAEYEKLYVSSEVGVKKHSGRLFDHVLADLGVPPDSILHIGDNVDADVKMAKARGIKAFHLTKASEAYVESNSYRIWKRDADRHSWEWRMPLAIIANEMMDNPYAPQRRGTLFNGNGYQLGFSGAGPLILGFCKWVIEKAIEQGYERLYFLARDGKIVKEVYDRVAVNYANAPEAKYLLCSRRAVNLAKVSRFEDIVDLINVDYANRTKLGFLLESRFGLKYEVVASDVMAEHKLTWDERVTAADRPRIVKLLADLQNVIFDQARRERENYLEYLNEMGFMDDRRVAVVDIGYAGTMQESLRAISCRSMLDGLYLMTFRQALRRVKQNGMSCFAYLGDFIDRHDTFHPFCRHVPLYETLFSSQDTSFLRMERDWNGQLLPIFMPETPADARRVKFISTVHDGVMKFATIYAKVTGAAMQWLDFEPNKSIRAIQNCFDDPHPVDAKILVDLRFEDAYGGGGYKVILPSLSEIAKHECIWRNGREAILRQMEAVRQSKTPDAKKIDTRNADVATSPPKMPPIESEKDSGTYFEGSRANTMLQRMVGGAVRKFSNDKKFKKFERDPILFFADSKSRIMRGIGIIYRNERG